MSRSEYDELVHENIQEVLAAVALQDAGAASMTTAAGEEEETARSYAEQVATCSDSGMLNSKLLEVPQSSEATIRLLKARLKSVEEQLSIALKLNQDKDAEISELQKQLKLSTQKDAASSKCLKALEAQVERHRRAAEAAREALSAKEQQIKELSKEGAQAGRDKRVIEQESRARDVRLQRALEEIQKYKSLLQEVKVQGQEVKDVARTEHTKSLAHVKLLERQKGELLVVLRKQAKLIDVLRRQKAHLEAARLLSFTEEEFMRTLDAGA